MTMDWEARRAANERAEEDARVKAVRNDRLVGRGSCASIDECWEALDLVESFDRDGVKTPRAAVRWAHRLESCWLERWLDSYPDDPKLVEELKAALGRLKD
jgi:hypothetical protein